MLGDIAEGSVAFVREISDDKGFSSRFSIDFNRGKAAVFAEVEGTYIFEYGGLLIGEISKMGGRTWQFFFRFFFGFCR